MKASCEEILFPGPLTETPLELLNAWVKVSRGGDPLWTDTQIFFNGFTAGTDFGLFYPSLWGMDRTVCYFFVFLNIRLIMM